MKKWLGFAAMSLLLVALAYGIVFEVSTHVGRGWLRGEAFYEGRPTSYWRSVVEADLRCDPRQLTHRARASTSPEWWGNFKERLGLNAQPRSSLQLIDYDFAVEHDPKIGKFAVLSELAEDSNENIAGFAVDAPKHVPWSMPDSYWRRIIEKHSLRQGTTQ